MNQASFLRLALVLSDGQAMTFKKNLLKLVNLVLFENYGQDLTISEIIKKIRIITPSIPNDPLLPQPNLSWPMVSLLIRD